MKYNTFILKYSAETGVSVAGSGVLTSESSAKAANPDRTAMKGQ
ncbi:hypothetical protein OEZ60_20425 [Defluviimonas sp. WL0024]|uniref:Uncharacterized protein n=1 Tax=Albidovulum salinarum TaxID=2984153 RepID=A0ABT2X9C1_9RHOB|nr:MULTISPECIES: hypothetical protein [Defluviimonas]MCU9850354.1 hypothetical protein [Defluviimonas sp. WL0024]